jgi:hypothetical protein
MEAFFHAAHEELIERYMEENPSVTEKFAYEATVDEAWQRCVDRLSDIAVFLPSLNALLICCPSPGAITTIPPNRAVGA